MEMTSIKTAGWLQERLMGFFNEYKLLKITGLTETGSPTPNDRHSAHGVLHQRNMRH